MPDNRRPNFIIIYTDDQGYGDLSCMGAPDLSTPNIDSLAASGARFTNWYSNSPVCSPSRASLLTGKYPGHAGVRSILAGHRQATGLPRETPSLASALKRQGYGTAMSGKWHLGVAEDSMPHNHGFDDWFGFLAGCIDFYSHIFYWGMGGGTDPVHDLWDNGREVWRNGEYMTDLITERAVSQINSFAAHHEPFFLFVAYNAPHYPMHAPAEYMERFAHLPWDRQVMAAMLAAVDDGVGEILKALEGHGLRDNTCIFFSSDNGPSRETRNWLDGTKDPYYGGTAGMLKGHKFSLYDGGVRMPAILNWPGQVPAGQVIHEPGAMMDIFPTFVNAAGGSASDYDCDGLDILGMAARGEPSPHGAIFWEMNKQTAVRRGPWKLVLEGQLVEGAPPEDAVHLSNLDEDMGERVNLKDEAPEICVELREAAEDWREGLEKYWQARWEGRNSGLTGHPAKQ
ncbi:MAG: sulfatase-like hydrolase/transferase [Armatimonadetes bacterium]|nr:sulfatase-like hydrolase/transferase [Armatimonadota bacterium]